MRERLLSKVRTANRNRYAITPAYLSVSARTLTRLMVAKKVTLKNPEKLLHRQTNR